MKILWNLYLSYSKSIPVLVKKMKTNSSDMTNVRIKVVMNVQCLESLAKCRERKIEEGKSLPLKVLESGKIQTEFFQK